MLCFPKDPEHEVTIAEPDGCSSLNRPVPSNKCEPICGKTCGTRAMAKKRRLKIASYNINGINSRLHVLTRWLEEFEPDVVGLQELKCTDDAFPIEAIEALGYSAIWHGQPPRSWNGVALLSRVGDPVETRRSLPNDPNLEQSRYIEAAVCGILVGNMYAPNGNPWPGPKFDYKLAWLDQLKLHAQDLLDS